MTRLRLDPVFEEICFPSLKAYIEGLPDEWDKISADHKQVLAEIGEYVGQELRATGHSKLVFICTHNSRRSHFGQVWAAIAAAALGLQGLETFSGGTAVTAFNSRAASALERAGFRIHRQEGGNPVYEVTWTGRRPALICFSKIYDHNTNPAKGFGAVMTCTQADQACPMVPGAAARFGLPYEDPKTADGTPAETSRYDERCRQIAREMLYMCSIAAR